MEKAIELMKRALEATDEMVSLIAGVVENMKKAFELLEDLAKEAEREEGD